MDYSVVMEWDNPRSSDPVRALQTVGIVAEQMREQPGGGELLVVFAQDAFDGDTLRPELEKHVQGIEWRLIPTSDLRYYQLKNAGVREARGRVVVFFDSDLLIDEGCLQALLAALQEEGVEFVAGHTACDRETLADRTFAITWGFPVTPKQPVLFAGSLFYANNVAAPRELWLRFPFDDERVRYREMCVDVARRLRAAGVTIWIEPRAWASHPRPEPFVGRALLEGRDRMLSLRATRGVARAFFRLWSWFFKKAFGGDVRLWRERRSVDMPAWEVPAACVINTSYFFLAWASGVATLLRPGLHAASREERARARDARAALEGAPHES